MKVGETVNLFNIFSILEKLKYVSYDTI